jgi:hypothetical protein
MKPLRDHQPVEISDFGGLWNRGNAENTPINHFQDCNNVRFDAGSDVSTRDGIVPSTTISVPLSNVKRIYNYPTQTGNTLIVLTVASGIGNIYHVVNSTTVYGPLLSIQGMTDFAFIPFVGRAFISPFTSYTINGLSVEKGLPGEYLYVYKGDGTPARKTAGDPLVGTLTIANGAAGHTDPGFHIFAIVAETDTGYLTPPGAMTTFTTSATSSVSFGTVPVGTLTTSSTGPLIVNFQNNDDEENFEEERIFLDAPSNNRYLYEQEYEDTKLELLSNTPAASTYVTVSPYIVKRHLVATKVITNYNGNPSDYTFYFVPNAVINNNTDAFLNNVSFYDADLLADASHLFNNYSSIPAGAVLTNYHNRLCLAATNTDISLILVSSPGEPEAINQINGLLVVPLDGNPITNGAELRDVFYVTKRARTVAFIDNDGAPSSWPMTVVDNALGTCVHGISTVLDSGSSNVDFLIVATYQGVYLFNGRYIMPELSWKIEDYWKALDRNSFKLIQIVNAAIQKEIHIILPNRLALVGNYSKGMDSKNIRWTPWQFSMGVNTVSIWNIDQIIYGADRG